MKHRVLPLLLSLALLLQLLAGCAGGGTSSSAGGSAASSGGTSSAGSASSGDASGTGSSADASEPQGGSSSQGAGSSSEAAGPITVTDQAGREITLEAPAQTIVSCYYLVSASLLTLGLKDRIVGIEQKADTRELYKLCAPEFLDLPGVGSGKETNIEEIAAMEPDLVILSIKQEEAAETLTGLGIPTVLVEPETYEAFNEMITMLGAICGCEEKAAELTDYYNGVVDRVKGLTENVERPTVYLCGEATYLRTCPADMYQSQMIEMAGGTCVSSELEGTKWVDISAEQLAAWNPEVIFAVSYAEYTLDDIRNDAGLAGITAVAEDSLYTVPSEIEAWDYPQPSSVLGLLWMTHILHPDLISEDDYVSEAQSFYQDWLGVEVTRAQLGLA